MKRQKMVILALPLLERAVEEFNKRTGRSKPVSSRLARLSRRLRREVPAPRRRLGRGLLVWPALVLGLGGTLVYAIRMFRGGESIDRVRERAEELTHRTGSNLEQATRDTRSRVNDALMAEPGTPVRPDYGIHNDTLANGRGSERPAERSGAEEDSAAGEGARERNGGPEAKPHVASVGDEMDTAAMIRQVLGGEDRQAGGEPIGPSIQVSPGMKVVAFGGEDVGRVQSVNEGGSWVLDRPKGPDMLVPPDAIYKIEGTTLYLRVEWNRIHQQGWPEVQED